MNPFLVTLASILSSLSAIASNPAFGISGAAAKIVPVLGMVTALTLEGTEALGKMKELDEELKAIVLAGRVPSDEEWKGWDARHQAAHARLQS